MVSSGLDDVGGVMPSPSERTPGSTSGTSSVRGLVEQPRMLRRSSVDVGAKTVDVDGDVDAGRKIEEGVSEKPLDALDGRRIVELRIIAERLHSGCYACATPLQLVNCVKETRVGLASVLDVRCGSCGVVNMVQTSKTHPGKKGKNRVYDVNTKAAIGKSRGLCTV